MLITVFFVGNLSHWKDISGRVIYLVILFLQICDFGFARGIEPNKNVAMTLEVVTQYYRAPELLAGCKHYGPEIDMWAVGCVFAELLGRKVLFEAQKPSVQLEMITDLLGSPSLDDLRHITSSTSVKQLLSSSKSVSCQGQIHTI